MHDCPFCAMPPDRILLDTGHVYAVADLHPVAPGHHLIIPHRHVADPTQLSDVEALHTHRAIRRLVAAARAGGIEGFTIGVNAGEAAGQTVGHAHTHLIPRRHGDHPDPTGGIRAVIPGMARYPA